ncbi:DEAD/DEAH box helicase family protein [Hymenobacter sp. ISL-91]|uniref:DEAD/DEAH box helicase family protein n=1 Tax=Hymenobacter sp. ISL-91 TaxID=2819151 RepID=UPI001BE7584C|nr:DEAD/DEAH box helicase family protein [Hymenobacter sp. ISL-91]MBT2559564.1 DEAD/DEAH box helicase family protein [Hymenobacter sp. ISL-91]
MKQLTRATLKPFQLRAADELTQKLQTYPSPPYKPRYNPETGQPYPFICRLKAITGSGKTPMIAVVAAALGDAIILWTTNRGAVISQTLANLSAGGSYAPLLPEDTTLKALGDLAPADWADLLSARTGLTILLGTVALFNRDDAGKENLNLHKDRNGTSYWEMLAGRGPDGRNRPLYIVYDEAHGTTAKQFGRLTELDPLAFILASASPLPPGLEELVPGSTPDEKAAALERQTVVVNTGEVVEAGLLKTRLYLVDCSTTREQAVRDANDKWQELRTKAPGPDKPIWCGVVNSTLDGLEVWAVLTEKLGVDPTKIAVHLSKVNDNVVAAGATANWNEVQDTLKAKKTPEQLRADGYTHIIWNLSLREGWDEPWAYVAYLDGIGKSAIDISQKIGRFLRQPNATPFADGDLNSAYFYFNVPDEEFSEVVKNTQKDLQSEGYEIITMSAAAARKGGSRTVPVKKAVRVTEVAESFGEDLTLLDEIVLNAVPDFSEAALKAPGKVKTKILDVRRNQEDAHLETVETRTENADVLVWRYLFNRLEGIDTRVVRKENTCFSPDLKMQPRMRQRMHYGSEAMRILHDALPDIERKLNTEFRLEREYDKDYTVGDFVMSSPNLQTDDQIRRDRYAVRPYVNALHAEYNGLNKFEAAVAEALDKLGNDWCRNPVKTGYGIPIPKLGEGTTDFYPDFLLWGKKNTVWAIDPKGKHLLQDAIQIKLHGLADIAGMPQRIRVALIVEGNYDSDGRNVTRRGKVGCSLIWKDNSEIKAKPFESPGPLVAYLVKL